MIKLYKAFIEDIGWDELLKEEELSEKCGFYNIGSISNSMRKKQSLAGHILLRRGVKELFGRDSYKISYNENSKPLLSFCNFSIAHTEKLAVCAFSDNAIGVDAEQIREIKNIKKIRFFSDAEHDYIYAGNDASVRFLRIWTRKEAYVKMLGGSMAKNGDVDVSSDISGTVFYSYEFDGHIITVCEADN